jgi:NAD(P)-dependent dehydrogenase (short-subunit alcohol dehydrogenase family)
VTKERAHHARVTVVSGAARGIGVAVLDGLAEAGWTDLAVDRCADVEDMNYPLSHPADLEAVAARWLGPVQAVIGDVQDAQAHAALASPTEHDHGGPDAAVAAAAVIDGGKALWNEPPQTLETLWEINSGIWAPASPPSMPWSGSSSGWPLTCAEPV